MKAHRWLAACRKPKASDTTRTESSSEHGTGMSSVSTADASVSKAYDRFAFLSRLWSARGPARERVACRVATAPGCTRRRGVRHPVCWISGMTAACMRATDEDQDFANLNDKASLPRSWMLNRAHLPDISCSARTTPYETCSDHPRRYATRVSTEVSVGKTDYDFRP